MIDLSYNQLSGEITWKLAYLQRLASLDLSFNQLTGSIPPQLYRVKGLVALNLNSNLLTGPVPSQLGRLEKIQKMGLQDNLLSGSLPAITKNWKKLLSFNVTNNFLSGPIPDDLLPKGKYPYIGLSSNYFYGTPSTDSDVCNFDNVEVNDNCLLADSTQSCSSNTLSEQKTPAQCTRFCGMNYKTVRGTTTFSKPCQGCKTGATCTSSSSQSSPVVSFACQGC